VLPFAQQTRQIKILHSLTSAIYGQSDYQAALKSGYLAGHFMNAGHVGFYTEANLQKLTEQMPPVLVLPRVTHLPDEGVAAVQRYLGKGGTVVALGREPLGRDQRGEARQVEWEGDLVRLPADLEAHALKQRLERAVGEKLERPIRLRAVDDATWGVEARAVPEDDGYLFYAVNLAKETKQLELTHTDQQRQIAAVRDVLTGERLQEPRLELEPQTFRLLRIVSE